MFKLLIGYLVFVNLMVTIGSYRCLYGKKINESFRCSGTYECEFGNDEIDCPESDTFSNSCQDPNCSTSFYTNDQNCDGMVNCLNCFDEDNCSDSVDQKYFRCDSKSICTPLPLLCDGFIDCPDGSDERRMGFGFKCNGVPTDANAGVSIGHSTVVPYRCIVPQQQFKFLHLNNFDKRHSVCMNGEDQCYMLADDGKPILNISKCWPCLDGTIVQREQTCDTVFDCPDLSDECLCVRQFTSEICDPLLRDHNCSGNTVPCVLGTTCIDVYQICNGVNDCPNGTDEVRCKNTPDCPATTIACESYDTSYRINAVKCNGRFECLNGEDECNVGCPDQSPYCDFYPCGERTKGLCASDSKTDCGPSPQETCDGIAVCEDKSDERFCPYLKHCDENNPSSSMYYDHCTADRCNFVQDCENMVDELNCSSLTHFFCDNNKTLLPTSKVSDGVFDCKDYSDECIKTGSSISSQTELIGNTFLNVALWIIMTLAMVGNLIVIVNTSVDIVNANRKANPSSSTAGLCFKLMLLNLAMSDLLMGIYLLVIATKSVEFSGTYCQQKKNWLLNSQCVFAGVIAVVSSQMSVSMLVIMASYRLYVVMKPFKAKHMGWKRLISIIAFSWFLSTLLAVIPTFPSITYHLATEIIIDQPYIPLSVSTRQLIKLVETVNQLPGERQPISDVTSLSVSSFCKIFNKSLVVPYYCEDSSQTTFGSFGYYTTDGVCLPRYYGSSNEVSFLYSFMIVMMNFVAFLYMLIVYVVLHYHASNNKAQANQGNINTVSQAQSKRSQALSGTIARIIITDFLCWVPICIMSLLSFAGIEMPGVAYQITAIFLIPINSAVNPWIYSSFLVGKVKEIPLLIRIPMQQRQSS